MPGKEQCPYRGHDQGPAYHDVSAACNDAGGRINRDTVYDMVKEAMYRLMPGWFTKMDEIMDPDEPFHSIRVITEDAIRNPSKSIDDLVHEHFRDDWFAYHSDGDEDW